MISVRGKATIFSEKIRDDRVKICNDATIAYKCSCALFSENKEKQTQGYCCQWLARSWVKGHCSYASACMLLWGGGGNLYRSVQEVSKDEGKEG